MGGVLGAGANAVSPVIGFIGNSSGNTGTAPSVGATLDASGGAQDLQAYFYLS